MVLLRSTRITRTFSTCHHQADFGIEAEWHSSATSHGKSAWDGVGGTVKLLAARASLQCPYKHQIMIPFQKKNSISGPWIMFQEFISVTRV